MHYDLHRPCDDCPFRREGGIRLTVPRILEISTIFLTCGAGDFACHKTTVDDPDDMGVRMVTNDSKHCAGALIFAEKNETPTQMMRICERLRNNDGSPMYDALKLKGHDEVFDTQDEMLEASVEKLEATERRIQKRKREDKMAQEKKRSAKERTHDVMKRIPALMRRLDDSASKYVLTKRFGIADRTAALVLIEKNEVEIFESQTGRAYRLTAKGQKELKRGREKEERDRKKMGGGDPAPSDGGGARRPREPIR